MAPVQHANVITVISFYYLDSIWSFIICILAEQHNDCPRSEALRFDKNILHAPQQ